MKCSTVWIQRGQRRGGAGRFAVACGRLWFAEALLQFRQRGVERVLQHALHGFRGGGDALRQHVQIVQAHRIDALGGLAQGVQAGLVRRARMLLWGRVEQVHGTQGASFAGVERATGAISTRRFFVRPGSSVLAATGCWSLWGPAGLPH